MDQRFDFGKFTLANNIQYQKVNQQKDIDEILGDPLALNVPEWLIRSTFMLTSSLFKNSLFFQTGATFFYFTEFYADQFNPLLSEFVTQNNTKIGNYPRVDVFFNANTKFISNIDFHEFFGNSNQKLIAGLHPLLSNKQKA